MRTWVVGEKNKNIFGEFDCTYPTTRCQGVCNKNKNSRGIFFARTFPFALTKSGAGPCSIY